MRMSLKNYDRIHWEVGAETGITHTLSDFLANTHSGDLPQEVVSATKTAILDALAGMMAGMDLPVNEKLSRFVQMQGGKPENCVVGSIKRTNRFHAALLNGALAQSAGACARYEETLAAPAAVVAAAFAAGEPLFREGTRLIAAVALGCETACRLMQAAQCVPTLRPLDPTSTFAPFGAAAAAGKMMDFSAFDMENALSLCPSQSAAPYRAAATQAEIGRIHAGFAASWGVRSACFAKEGLSGPRDILEGSMGFFKCVSGFHDDDRTTRYNVHLVTEKLGEQWLMKDMLFEDQRGTFAGWDHQRIEEKFLSVGKEKGFAGKTLEKVIGMVNELEKVDVCAHILYQLTERNGL